MSEKDNLQEADGIEEEIKASAENVVADETEVKVEDVLTEVEAEIKVPKEAETEEKIETVVEVEATVTEAPAVKASKEDETKDESENEVESSEKTKDAQDEIDASNAEDAEDTDNSERHELTEKDYHAMSMEALVEELESLVTNRKIQVIRDHVDTIRSEFNAKFSTLIEEKKEEFLAEGGNTIDFRFSHPVKAKFNDIYKTYRKKRQDYYKSLESSLQANHSKRLEIIEEIKGLINVEENINTTYKHFKELQESWRNAGPIPRDKYNNVWNNYHHHVEIFYDFLHLNRDLRDLDFKHNLEQKLKIIARAEELAKDDNSNRAFREIQALHKIWKEELGPVDREHREDIWERFSKATKAIHEKRQDYYNELDKAYEKNLVVKHEIITKIDELAADEGNNHSAWQKKIKAIEELRTQFFNAGKVPMKVNEKTWAKFKTSVRSFNRKKNSFYKGLKKEQYNNLQKKIELIKIAEANKDNTDFEVTTPLMKKIQHDWKQIGHVPRRDSDKIWKQFKTACNAYFEKIHESKNEAKKEEVEALEKKSELLDNIKSIEFSEDKKDNLKLIKEQTKAWKALGHVPYNKRDINKKFNTAIDGLYNKLDIGKKETELLKYNNKLETLSTDKRSLDSEHNFIRKKIDDLKGEIIQLENNLQFFSNVDDDNPLVKDVHKNIQNHKNELTVWEEKLRNVKKFY
ncbi:MAG: DUF349 domain-containing protein [Bacteroidetes bacterium]|nr:MAG: DUF349 domain-containing protein [Bacteroidota bacterium]